SSHVLAETTAPRHARFQFFIRTARFRGRFSGFVPFPKPSALPYAAWIEDCRLRYAFIAHTINVPNNANHPGTSDVATTNPRAQSVTRIREAPWRLFYPSSASPRLGPPRLRPDITPSSASYNDAGNLLRPTLAGLQSQPTVEVWLVAPMGRASEASSILHDLEKEGVWTKLCARSEGEGVPSAYVIKSVKEVYLDEGRQAHRMEEFNSREHGERPQTRMKTTARGLEDLDKKLRLIPHADVIFFSKSYARSLAYTSPRAFLLSQALRCAPHTIPAVLWADQEYFQSSEFVVEPEDNNEEFESVVSGTQHGHSFSFDAEGQESPEPRNNTWASDSMGQRNGSGSERGNGKVEKGGVSFDDDDDDVIDESGADDTFLSGMNMRCRDVFYLTQSTLHPFL
ncbi:hypothetical protein FRB98_004292, partial [Tulasnella sp. 332]